VGPGANVFPLQLFPYGFLLAFPLYLVLPLFTLRFTVDAGSDSGHNTVIAENKSALCFPATDF
jgi:hypothetical protein